jgi:hypothetical protein
MPRHRRRLIGAALTAAILAAVVAATGQPEPREQTFRITFGLTDKTETDWSGQLAVSGGKVIELTGWHFENKDKVQGKTAWTCRTHKHIAPLRRYPVQDGWGKPKGPTIESPWPVAVDVTVRGKDPSLTLKLAQGTIGFVAAEVKLGQPKVLLDGRVRIERLPPVSLARLPAPIKTADPFQDDYPAFWIDAKSGKQYLAWLSYRKAADRVLLAERDGPTGAWSEPVEVDGPGQHFRVALAGTAEGTLWIVWSAQRNHNWDLYGRPYKNGKLGDEVRLTEAPGPDAWHRMTSDSRGRVWLVWQGFHGKQSDIFARCADGAGWHKPVRVSISEENDWDPCVTADPKADRVWVGWDSYEIGRATYNVRVRSLSGGPEPKLGDVLVPEACPLFQAQISLACDGDGRLWAAWDESGPQWGKDNGYLADGMTRKDTTRLYQSRTIRILCLVGGKWQEPTADWKAGLPEDLQEFNQLAQLQADQAGRMWLAFRHRTCRVPRADGWAALGRWDIYATAYLGDRWLPPIPLQRSAGRLDMRIASGRDSSGVYFAYASDNRTMTMTPRNQHVAVSRLEGAPAAGKMHFAAGKRAYPVFPPVHPKEKEQVARIRAYKIEVGGKVYRIYRGDLHRHTSISSDGAGDGSLEDLHRYALDAAGFDYGLVTDHNMGNDNEYCWWRTQQANDLYTVPGSFISMYGYERSVPYPAGHHNVIWPERGHRTLPLPKPTPAALARDLGRLYAELHRSGGICTGHTSASSQGTDWQAPHDPLLEPVVEIYQGYHTSYEALGAPKAINAESDRIHGDYEPAGFVVLALDKGYRLGFQASSDHNATHLSYACILSEDFSRKGLVEALRHRHSYAATDNIILDVRMGSHIMGDELRTAEPQLDVVVIGTGPIDRVEIFRNGGLVHTRRPAKDAAEVRFSWRDPAPRHGRQPSYYYVRVQQRDGQMAWASPFWVTVEE